MIGNKMKIAIQSKRAILSKSDDYTFDAFQAKTIMRVRDCECYVSIPKSFLWQILTGVTQK